MAATKKGMRVLVFVFVDLMGPVWQDFESKNGPQLKQGQDAGKVTIEYRPISSLDRMSQGTKYATRAAAAAACVAANSPSNYKAYLDELYKDKPAENSSGLDNATLNEMAVSVGATGVSSCIDQQTYASYVTYSTELIIAHGLEGTPEVYVDGIKGDNVMPYRSEERRVGDEGRP